MVFSLLKCFQSKINALSMLNAFSRQIKSNFNANIAFVFAKGTVHICMRIIFVSFTIFFKDFHI